MIGYVKAMRDRPNRAHVVEQFEGSILFIGGEKDAGISPDSMEKQASLSKNPSLHLLPDVAHMGMFENEQETITLMAEFLSQTVKTG
jgi:pimeloyl-ACP methyl ester carboxylesterase